MARTESQKERYLFLKAHKICVSCGQENAAPHSILCIDCREQRRYYYNHVYDKSKRREKDRVNKRKQRDERIKNGLCPSCGNEKPDGYTYQLCPSCRARYREYDQKRRRKNGALGQQERDYIGLCRQCNKPAVEGRCYCEEHLEKARKSARIATEHRLASLAWKNKKEELFAWTFLRRCSNGLETQNTTTQPSYGVSQ